MTTFVSSFYDLNLLEKRIENKTTDFYIPRAQMLLGNDVSWVIWVDKNSVKYLPQKDNIKYVIFDIEDLPVYNILQKNDVTNISYHNEGQNNKDTYYYHCLMISKTYFVSEAIRLNYFGTSQYAWIDIGIYHIFKPEEYPKIYPILKKIENTIISGIRIPGPNQTGIFNLCSFLDYTHPVWCFCGGFFCGTQDKLLEFNNEVTKMLGVLSQLKIINWEVNIWAEIFRKRSDLFDIYWGDHNISMIENY